MLTNRCDSARGRTFNRRHRPNCVLRRDDVTHAPTRHRVSFGKPVQGDGALCHAGKRAHRNMFKRVVYKLAVNLIGDNDEVVLNGKLGNRLGILPRNNAARRVAWRDQQQRFRLRRDALLNLLGAQVETVLGVGRHRHAHAARVMNRFVIGGVARVGHEDFVAWVEQGAHD